MPDRHSQTEYSKNIYLNGESQATDALYLTELLARMGIDEKSPGVAVACNGAVVTRADWAQRSLQENDHIEVIRANVGG